MSVATALLLFELLDPMALIAFDLTRQRNTAVKCQMSYRNHMRSFGPSPTYVQAAEYTSHVSDVENASDIAFLGNGDLW